MAKKSSFLDFKKKLFRTKQSSTNAVAYASAILSKKQEWLDEASKGISITNIAKALSKNRNITATVLYAHFKGMNNPMSLMTGHYGSKVRFLISHDSKIFTRTTWIDDEGKEISGSTFTPKFNARQVLTFDSDLEKAIDKTVDQFGEKIDLKTIENKAETFNRRSDLSKLISLIEDAWSALDPEKLVYSETESEDSTTVNIKPQHLKNTLDRLIKWLYYHLNTKYANERKAYRIIYDKAIQCIRAVTDLINDSRKSSTIVSEEKLEATTKFVDKELHESWDIANKAKAKVDKKLQE